MDTSELAQLLTWWGQNSNPGLWLCNLPHEPSQGSLPGSSTPALTGAECRAGGPECLLQVPVLSEMNGSPAPPQRYLRGPLRHHSFISG